MIEYITTYEIMSDDKWICIANATHNSQVDSTNWITRQQERFPNDVARFTTRVVHYDKSNYLHGAKEIRKICSPLAE